MIPAPTNDEFIENCGALTMDAREVAQTQTVFLPDSNEYMILYFGPDGTLLSKQRIAADAIEQFNNIHVPHMEYDMNGMRWYDESGEVAWQTDGAGVYVRGTNSDEYCMASRNLDIDAEIFGPFDIETEPRHTLTEKEYQMYLDSLIRTRGRHLYETYIKGEWKILEEEEQSDIQEERGGALDEFLEKFTPQKTTPERSDEQE